MENSVPLALQRSLPQKAELELSVSVESSEIAKCVLCEITYYREIQGDVGRCREMWGDVGRYGEIAKCVLCEITYTGRCREIWGYIGRYGEM